MDMWLCHPLGSFANWQGGYGDSPKDDSLRAILTPFRTSQFLIAKRMQHAAFCKLRTSKKMRHTAFRGGRSVSFGTKLAMLFVGHAACVPRQVAPGDILPSRGILPGPKAD